MFRKELMKVGLIATISLFSLVGCSGGEEPKPSETTSVEVGTDKGETGKEIQKETTTEETTTQEATEEDTTGETSVGKFDPADVCKNISIDGRIVEFPWTLNKLGDEYEFDEVVNDLEDDGVSAANLMYKGDKKFVICIGDEEVDRDSPMVVFSFSPSDNVAVYGLGKGSMADDVVKVFGEPNEVREDELMGCDYVYVSDEMLLEFTFYKEKLLKTYINVFGDWK